MNLTPRATRRVLTCLLASTFAFTGCSSDSEPKGDSGEQLAVTCDWLDHRLSFVDLAKLEQGTAREDALLGELDLSDYAAGPLEMAIVPGTHLAIVSLSAGFFSLSPLAGVIVDATDIPTDPGKLLFVDLEERQVVGELVTGLHPMSVAFTSDGKRAFVTNFGTPEVTEIDVEARSVIRSVNVGVYSEAIVLDDSGEVGIFSYSAAGNVRTFGADDFEGTLSAPVELAGDSAGVAFFPGTKLAYVVHSPMPLTGARGGHALLDVSNPQQPVTLEDVRFDTAPFAYPAQSHPERDSVIVPGTLDGTVRVDEITLDDQGATQVTQSIEVGTADLLGAYGMEIGEDGRVWLASPAARGLIAVDLETQTSYPVAWGSTNASPSCIERMD